jgi:hypothetical protein
MVRPSSSTPSVAHTPTSAAPTPAVTGSELKKRKLPDEPDHDEQGDESTIKKIKIELPAESMQDAEAEFGSNAEAAQIDAAAAAAAEEERAARRAAKLAKKQQVCFLQVKLTYFPEIIFLITAFAITESGKTRSQIGRQSGRQGRASSIAARKAQSQVQSSQIRSGKRVQR